MRITIYDVLDYLASGMTQEKILSDFPYVTPGHLCEIVLPADRER